MKRVSRCRLSGRPAPLHGVFNNRRGSRRSSDDQLWRSFEPGGFMGGDEGRGRRGRPRNRGNESGGYRGKWRSRADRACNRASLSASSIRHLMIAGVIAARICRGLKCVDAGRGRRRHVYSRHRRRCGATTGHLSRRCGHRAGQHGQDGQKDEDDACHSHIKLLSRFGYNPTMKPSISWLGLAHTAASSAALMLSLEDLATMAIAWVVFKENVDRRLLIGAGAILGGALILSWGGGLAGVVGFFGYGASLVLFVLALRHLGTAQTGAYLSTAPSLGAALALLLFHEPVTLQLIGAASPSRSPRRGIAGTAIGRPC